MPRKERQEKNAIHAMNKELDSEMTDEERERKLKAGMGTFGGVNKGEEQLFGARRLRIDSGCQRPAAAAACTRASVALPVSAARSRAALLRPPPPLRRPQGD